MAGMRLQTDSVDMTINFKPEDEWAVIGIVTRLVEELDNLNQIISDGLVKVHLTKKKGD